MIISGLAILAVSTGVAAYAMLRAPQFGADPETLANRVSNSPNYREGSFRNWRPINLNTQDKSMLETLREYFGQRSQRKPQFDMPRRELNSIAVGDGRTHVTWMGHSTLLVEIDGLTILTDPVFSDHASPFSWLPPKSFYSPMPITPDGFDKVDVVLISHDHYDHLDHQSIRALAEKAGRFVVPLGIGAHLVKWGVDEDRITELDWWQETTAGTVTLTATPAQHFSGRGLTGGNQTLWAGWAIRGMTENLFFSGDSGYFPGFREIGDRLGPFDLTMLECGAYNESWANVHMMPEQTAQAHQDLRGRALMPIHWGRFDLALHPWNEPVQRLQAAANQAGVNVVTPVIGERFVLSAPLPRHAWWKSGADTHVASANVAGQTLSAN